jgi:hypothetical protein
MYESVIATEIIPSPSGTATAVKAEPPPPANVVAPHARFAPVSVVAIALPPVPLAFALILTVVASFELTVTVAWPMSSRL